MVVENRARINRQIEAIANARHGAPVFRPQTVSGVAGFGVRSVKRFQFISAAERQDVGEAIAGGIVESTPMILRAKDFAGRNAGEALAGAIPDQYPAIGIKHERRYDKVLHQSNGKCMGAIDCRLICHEQPRDIYYG